MAPHHHFLVTRSQCHIHPLGWLHHIPYPNPISPRPPGICSRWQRWVTNEFLLLNCLFPARRWKQRAAFRKNGPTVEALVTLEKCLSLSRENLTLFSLCNKYCLTQFTNKQWALAHVFALGRLTEKSILPNNEWQIWELLCIRFLFQQQTSF